MLHEPMNKFQNDWLPISDCIEIESVFSEPSIVGGHIFAMQIIQQLPVSSVVNFRIDTNSLSAPLVILFSRNKKNSAVFVCSFCVQKYANTTDLSESLTHLTIECHEKFIVKSKKNATQFYSHIKHLHVTSCTAPFR